MKSQIITAILLITINSQPLFAQAKAGLAKGAARWLSEVIEHTRIVSYDARGSVLPADSVPARELKTSLSSLLDEALGKIPPGSYKSEADFNRALESALKKSQSWEHSFDVTTGKLKLKYKTRTGEATGEIDAYSTATAALGGLAKDQPDRKPPPAISVPPQPAKYVARCVFNQSPIQYLITSTFDVLAVLPNVPPTLVGRCTAPTYPGFSYMIPANVGVFGVDFGGTIWSHAANGILVPTGSVTNP